MGIDLGCVGSGKSRNWCEYSRLVSLSDYLISSRHRCDWRGDVSVNSSYRCSVACN